MPKFEHLACFWWNVKIFTLLLSLDFPAFNFLSMLILYRYQFLFLLCCDIGFLPFPLSDFMWYISNSNLFLFFHYFTPVFTHYFTLFKKIYKFFLAMQHLSSWTRNQTHAPLQWRQSLPLDHGGNPHPLLFLLLWTLLFFFFHLPTLILQQLTWTTTCIRKCIKSIQNKRWWFFLRSWFRCLKFCQMDILALIWFI